MVDIYCAPQRKRNVCKTTKKQIHRIVPQNIHADSKLTTTVIKYTVWEDITLNQLLLSSTQSEKISP